jgi:hypothetical protein
MPTIDSKRVVALLTELEPVLERRLPASLIKRGGYQSADALKNDLMPKLKTLAIAGKAKPLSQTNASKSASPVAVNTNV